MGIRVVLHHKTIYNYDRLVTLSPQIVRLRPAPHSRTPVTSYSLRIEPKDHFINWQQDPHGNFLARLVFPNPTRHFSLEVSLAADMTVINPFDFFLEPYAEKYPFRYEPLEERDLKPFWSRHHSARCSRNLSLRSIGAKFESSTFSSISISGCNVRFATPYGWSPEPKLPKKR